MSGPVWLVAAGPPDITVMVGFPDRHRGRVLLFRSEDDVKITLMALCESMGARLREQNCLCSTVAVGIRDNRLLSCDRQARLLRPTASTLDIWEAAVEIFKHRLCLTGDGRNILLTTATPVL